ncbi:MAG: porin family protein [Flavobacteriaceae bacterium]|jgi:hypothetical protein|nr:porin family protein [Flavobacteriaceae bacterium]
MNDKWINDLNKKMKGHTEIGPEGLWEDLEQTLFVEDKGKIIPLWSDTKHQSKLQKVKPKVRIIKRFTDVAIAAIAIIVIGMFTYVEDGKLLPSMEEIKVKPVKSIVDLKNVFTGQEEGLSTVKKEEKKKKSNSSILSSKEEQDLFEKNNALIETELVQKEEGGDLQKLLTNYNEEDREEEMSNDIAILENKDLKAEEFVVETNNKQNAEKKRGFSFSLFSGNMSSNASQKSNGYATMSGVMKVDGDNLSAGPNNSKLIDIYKANLDKEVVTNIKHKQPIRFGLSFGYQLNDNWTINSGITYTKLSSEIHSGSKDYKVIGDQTVHFVGIPIQVNYAIWQKGNFSTYVTGGAHFEKSVAGSFKIKYQEKDKVEDGSKESVMVKGIQSSINMGVGAEYKLGRGVGLFLEPGARYHFNSDNSVNTIYNEKPFNFNVQVGLRYVIPAKSKSADAQQEI